MIAIAQIRKLIIKERLIPTALVILGLDKKRAAKAALKVKQGEKSDQIADRRNCLRFSRTEHVY
ncbi:hypothetical protein RU07_10580 [Agrobacterium tumefaciens]|uniref:Uncharacterized protein n=1 Tax=Agrobacterium tumefaciens TaxID=358 RepID=A0A0D0K3M4_AGRTU|nr:hypothetical protein RU07_10580 [Agrobacterium tumefaciens]